MTRSIVTVFGSGKTPRADEAYRRAYAVGKTIAQLGLSLCNGGYGGTMEAGARGAVEAGGHTIGVTCTRLGRRRPNPFIRQEIPTFDLLSRLNTLVRLGRAYVVLPGGTGTLAELALVWELLGKALLKKHRPLLVFVDWWRPVLELMSRAGAAPIAQPVRDVAEVHALLAAHFQPPDPPEQAG